jgi:predicted transcriptional regulator
MRNGNQKHPFVSTEDAVEVDAETAVAIEEGIRAADEGRTTPSEQVPKLIRQWISKFSTQTRR